MTDRGRGFDLAAELCVSRLPKNDGWHWLYRWFDRIAARGSRLRSIVGGYFWPKSAEQAGAGRMYSLLGVEWFGRVIPTGGIAIRRITGLKMSPYTLRAPSKRAAREFYYRTCVFEALHLPFLVALVALTFRQAALGRLDLALEDMVVNLVFNIYPIMHHRRTRVRIVNLLEASRPETANRAQGSAASVNRE